MRIDFQSLSNYQVPFDALDEPLDSVTFNYDHKPTASPLGGQPRRFPRFSTIVNRSHLGGIENRRRKIFIIIYHHALRLATKGRIYYISISISRFSSFFTPLFQKFFQFVRYTNRIYLSIYRENFEN